MRPSARVAGCSASSSWRCFSTPSFCRPGVDAEVVRGVVEDLVDEDAQGVVGLAGGHQPLGAAVLGDALAHRARRRHPVERLVGAAVGVDQHRAVRLEHQHARRERQVGGQPPGIVHLAARHDDPHDGRIYSGPVTDHEVRPALRRDLAQLDLTHEASRPGLVMVVGDPPVGHVRVDLLDGHAHLDQIVVGADLGGTNTRALVEAVCERLSARGLGQLTAAPYAGAEARDLRRPRLHRGPRRASRSRGPLLRGGRPARARAGAPGAARAPHRPPSSTPSWRPSTRRATSAR